MKSIYSLFAGMLILCISACKKEEITAINRPATPTDLSVSKGDTSVFISWNGVPSATSYLIVRGLDVIAKDITTTSYEDQTAPDTAVEYRLYAVNDEGWRSYRYLADTGYTAIPSGILPRPPAVTATTNDYKQVTLTLTGGRFATSFKIYRDGTLIADKVQQNTYVDAAAPTENATYTVYSVNNNGTSTSFASAVGKKAFVYDGSFEERAVGYILKPWTFVADNIGFYTEGDPTVVAGEGLNGSKALSIVNGKAQLLFDWGGVPVAGKYRMSFVARKSNGGFWVVPNFAGAEHLSADGTWKTFTITTGTLQKGDKFNVKLEPYGSDGAFVDNWRIEYLAQ